MDLSQLSRDEKEQLIILNEETERRRKTRRLFGYYPDTGTLRRELYVKHLSFFQAGNSYRERLMLAANRVGKTEGVGAYEMTLHLTGLYPVWWNGRRFDRPISAWVAGDTGTTVRDIVQLKLYGKFIEPGTGMIPADCIVDRTLKRGIGEALDVLYVKHVSGGISQLTFKSYDQRRESFQGTKQDVIWLDEEPPLDIYTECLMRTTGTDGTDDDAGMLMLTFTPLMGMSETVMQFLPNGQLAENESGSKFVVMATWDDAPHLTEKEKQILWAAIPPFQRDARSKGIPQLGSGAIYPVPESDFVVDDFQIPEHWPKVYGMDVGWNRTAAPWLAYDRENDTVYIYSEHYRGQAEPSIHVQGIKARGDWIPGVIDPAARGRSQVDGEQLFQQYIDLGLNLQIADNGVESGIYKVWERLSTGRLRVFKSCQNWLFEFRLYRRDEKGRIVKSNDHLMDATRYGIVTGLTFAITKPAPKVDAGDQYYVGSRSWMG